MYLTQKNNLSGFLDRPLNDDQRRFLESNKENLSPVPTGPDGNLYYKNKIIVNYTEVRFGGSALQNMLEISKINFDGFDRTIYRDIQTGANYIDLGNTAPLLVRLVKVMPTTTTTTTTNNNNNNIEESNCPCNCRKQTIVEKVYLSPVQIKGNDTPVRVKINKKICKSKNNNQTKYMFDCNTSLSEINRQLNLNGLADDCPCDCVDQLVEQTYYITDSQCSNCIPFSVSAEKIICEDTSQITNKQIDCNDLKESLNKRGYIGSQTDTKVYPAKILYRSGIGKQRLSDKFDCMISDDRLQGLSEGSEGFIKANDYLVPKMALGIIAGSLIIKLIKN